MEENRAPTNVPLVEGMNDPRLANPHIKGKAQKQKGKGINTESFDPRSTLVRPSLRVVVGPKRNRYAPNILKHDDVVICPDFFCAEDDLTLYHQLLEEMKQSQQKNDKESEWISWHEGAHLITKNPTGCPTFQMIQDKIAAYFDIAQKSVGTRFNYYTSDKDWKPFHHDSAAFNPHRARSQNITVGVSFGAMRELAFLNAKTGERIYFPQTNGMLFSFGRDVNINFKHGINALDEGSYTGQGRISIILWGMAANVVEETNSPPMIVNGSAGGYDAKEGSRRARDDRRRPDERSRSRDDRDRRDQNRGGHRDDSRDRDRDRDRDRNRRDDYERRERRDEYDRRDDYERREDKDRDRVRDRDRDRDRDRGGHREVCNDFRRGRCSRGDGCRYAHTQGH